MKKNDKIIVNIEEVLFPNKGIGYVEGQKIIVKNVLPNSTAAADVRPIPIIFTAISTMLMMWAANSSGNAWNVQSC